MVISARTEENRVFERVDFKEPVQFQWNETEHFGGSLSCDISENGVRIDLFEFIPVNTELTLKIRLKSREFVECIGKVVWINQLPFSDRYQAGIRFYDNFGSVIQSKDALRKFISEAA